MVQVTVRYFAAARAAAGIAQETISASTLGELLSRLRSRHGERLSSVLAVSSLLLDGLHIRDGWAPLPPDAEVDVLPPFAGG